MRYDVGSGGVGRVKSEKCEKREKRGLGANRELAWWIAGGALALTCSSAWADDADDGKVDVYSLAVAKTSVSSLLDGDDKPQRRRGRSEVHALVLPSWDRPNSAVTDAASHHNNLGSFNSNMDMPATRVEFSHWVQGGGGAGVALGVVQPGSTAGPAYGGPAEVRDGASNGSNVELGLRWRSDWVGQRRIDIGAWRRVTSGAPDAYTLTQTEDGAQYAARVEMQFPSAKYGGLAPELGAIGLQMNGGGKVVVRAKRGGPMLYYRSNF